MTETQNLTSKRKKYKILDVLSGEYISSIPTYELRYLKMLLMAWNGSCGYGRYELVEIDNETI